MAGLSDRQRQEALRLKREKCCINRERRRRGAQKRRAERRKAKLRRAFEPVHLVEKFCTDRDDKMRAADNPERYYGWDPFPLLGDALDPQGSKRKESHAEPEEKEQAMWIIGRIPEIASEFFSAGQVGPVGGGRG